MGTQSRGRKGTYMVCGTTKTIVCVTCSRAGGILQSASESLQRWVIRMKESLVGQWVIKVTVVSPACVLQAGKPKRRAGRLVTETKMPRQACHHPTGKNERKTRLMQEAAPGTFRCKMVEHQARVVFWRIMPCMPRVAGITWQ